MTWEAANAFRQEEISHQVIIDKTVTINKLWSKETLHRKKIEEHQLQLNPG
jgi:hypothetical protein